MRYFNQISILRFGYSKALLLSFLIFVVTITKGQSQNCVDLVVDNTCTTPITVNGFCPAFSNTCNSLNGWTTSMGTPNLVFVAGTDKHQAYYYAEISQTSSGTEGLFHPFTFKSGQSYTITVTCAVEDASLLELYAANGLIQSFQTLTVNYCQGPVQVPTNKKLIGEIPTLSTAQLSLSSPYTFVPDRDYSQVWIYGYPSGSSLGGGQISKISICPNCFLGAPAGLGTSSNMTVLNWSSVANASSYTIYVTDNHSGSFTSSTLTSATNSVQYCPPSSGDLVSFTVTAICANNGSGTTSAPFSYTYIQTPLAIPANLTYSPPNTLSWSAVPNATAYLVNLVSQPGGGIAAYYVNGTSVSGSSAELNTGQTYQVSVAAANSCVISPYCTPISVAVASCSTAPTVAVAEFGTYIVLNPVTNALTYNIAWKNANGTIAYQINSIAPSIANHGFQATGVPHGSFYIEAQANCTVGTTAWGPAYNGSLQTTDTKIKKTGIASDSDTNDSSSEIKLGISEFSVFPNPSSSQVNIAFKSSRNGTAELFIMNEFGSQIVHKSVVTFAGDNTCVINTNEMINGVYIVKVVDGANTHVKKFIVLNN